MQEAQAVGAGGAAGAAGFFNNPKRFNVAVTRAQALLVVVGHPAMLKRDRQWGHLVRVTPQLTLRHTSQPQSALALLSFPLHMPASMVAGRSSA